VLGSINMDLAVRTPQLPSPGETVLGTDFRTSQGGKGANQAIAAARAGADVTVIGAVGSDTFGDELLGALRSEGINTDLVRRVDGPSGIAVITVSDDAENTIVVASGANGEITALTAVDEDRIRHSDVLVMQLEIPVAAVIAGANVAHDAGVPVLLNPSPARALPADLVNLLTVLVLNEGEASVLGDHALAAVPHAVTTLGARGARYRGPGGVTVEVDAPRVQPIDTTGAGDAFAGALAVRWAEAAPAAGSDAGPLDGAGAESHHAGPVIDAAAVSWACTAGALATTVHGAGESAPRRADIDNLADATVRPPQISPSGL
jgi:ribokinase